MTNEQNSPFVLEQLEEALEERQNPDRRKTNAEYEHLTAEDRRKEDRRTASATKH